MTNQKLSAEPGQLHFDCRLAILAIWTTKALDEATMLRAEYGY